MVMAMEIPNRLRGLLPGNDCDDLNPPKSPADGDGDGQSGCFGDCDDTNPDAYLGAAQIEDPDACMADADGDGYGSDNPGSGITAGSDCDDQRFKPIRSSPK